MTTSSFIFEDPRAPARRAAVMMYLLGVLGFFGGICIGAFGFVLRDVLTQPQFAQLFRHAHLPAAEIRLPIIVAGAICCVGGIFLGILGTFVRTGAAIPIIIGMALTAFGVAVTGLILGASLLVAQSQSDITIASAVWMLSVPVLLLIVLFIWLAAALRNVSYLRANQL